MHIYTFLYILKAIHCMLPRWSVTTGQSYYNNAAAEWVEKPWLTALSASMIRAHDAPMFSLQPPHPSHSTNSSLKASSGACESGLPVLGWMQPRTHLLNPSCSEFTAALYWQAKLAAASSLLPLPHPNCPCLLWFGQPKDSNTLYTHTSLHCIVFNGILQVKICSSAADISWDVQSGSHSS